jgi:hypothetical protein
MERPYLVGMLALVLSIPVAAVLVTHKSKGSEAHAEPASSTRPIKLTVAQKAELSGRPVVATGTYLDLSPEHALAESGRLELVRATLLDQPQDGARIPGADTFVGIPNSAMPHASLHMTPDRTTSRYLVDCVVDGAQEYWVRTWPGGGAQTFGAGQHVLVTLDIGASYAGDVEVAIAGKPAKGEKSWLFYGCDVTKL